MTAERTVTVTWTIVAATREPAPRRMVFQVDGTWIERGPGETGSGRHFDDVGEAEAWMRLMAANWREEFDADLRTWRQVAVSPTPEGGFTAGELAQLLEDHPGPPAKPRAAVQIIQDAIAFAACMRDRPGGRGRRGVAQPKGDGT